MLTVPEVIEQIPVKKLEYLPARAMDINQSKVSSNIEAIANLLHQGGVGDPAEVIAETAEGEQQVLDVLDISDWVVIIHEDLGTSKRDQLILKRRAIESTPWR
ncbi:hypothetical protein A0H81_08223 [Grifola frondosa]|uniref:DUF6589 domain-containing protein n=1 Tax=Grifola frondosa TaxID=5627 RepID=A0A1C7M4Z6_GRIFR|nr:hypothetical protein A0H81_08223 [Grifola frondosa]